MGKVPSSSYDAICAYCNGTMSGRPEYYSGRGVRTSDLGAKHLKMIHDGLVKDFGAEVGTAFCQMIEQIENMSATNFLNQFFVFFHNGFKWKKMIEETDIDVGPDDGGREAIAFATVVSAMFGGREPEVDIHAGRAIKNEFFRSVRYIPDQKLQKGHDRFNHTHPD